MPCPRTPGQVVTSEAISMDSIPFDEVRSLCGQFIRIGPEVCDTSDFAVVLQLEKTQPSLGVAVGGRRIRPAGGVQPFADYLNNDQMPLTGEALSVEAHVVGTSTDLSRSRVLRTPRLRLGGPQGDPISVVRCRPVGGHDLSSGSHLRNARSWLSHPPPCAGAPVRPGAGLADNIVESPLRRSIGLGDRYPRVPTASRSWASSSLVRRCSATARLVVGWSRPDPSSLGCGPHSP